MHTREHLDYKFWKLVAKISLKLAFHEHFLKEKHDEVSRIIKTPVQLCVCPHAAYR